VLMKSQSNIENYLSTREKVLKNLI
jgi:hypothetical protein